MDGEILSDEENHNMEMDFDVENDDSNHGVFPDDEAIEVPSGDPAEKKIIKPKKVVRNPQPKLDAIRLMGPRGIGILPNNFKDYKFKGKGHEKEDLNVLMKKMEHWSHRLFPKLTFDDMLKQLEKLGSKKQVQVLLRKIRMDILQSDELIVDNPDDVEVVETVDVFDQLLPSDHVVSQDAGFTFSTVPASQSQPREISADDRERMERNKQLALERRRSKLAERSSVGFSQTFSSQGDSVINSAATDPEGDLDEDMLKAFDHQDALQEFVSSSIIRSSNKRTDVANMSLDNRSPLKDNGDIADYTTFTQKESITGGFTTDNTSDICTEDDVLNSL